MTACPWLPGLVTLEDSGGDWTRYVDLLYSYFYADFVRTSPMFDSMRLGLKRHPVVRGKEWTFWHIIQEGPVESERTPNLERCSRIRWPRPVIEHCNGGEIKVWEERRRSEGRIHLWFENEDYLVVLARRRAGTSDEYVLLWTAFKIDAGHSRRKLQRRYEEYGALNS